MIDAISEVYGCDVAEAMRGNTKKEVSADTNARHRDHPEPGDYWNEMMVPVLLVLARNERGVLVITSTIDKGAGWMWDFDKAEQMTLAEMNETTRYCYCYPRHHAKAVGWWKEHLGIE